MAHKNDKSSKFRKCSVKSKRHGVLYFSANVNCFALYKNNF